LIGNPRGWSSGLWVPKTLRLVLHRPGPRSPRSVHRADQHGRRPERGRWRDRRR